MTVAVYPRLGELLRKKKLTLPELGREIERRFGMTVDPDALEHLTDSERIRQADLEVVAAAARILDVGLSDLFDVVLTPPESEEEGPRTLSPEQDRRLGELFDERTRRPLSLAEQAELDGLVAENGLNLRHYYLRQIAQQRGISVEEARSASDASLAEAIRWWRETEADPERYHELVTEAKRLRHRTRA